MCIRDSINSIHLYYEEINKHKSKKGSTQKTVVKKKATPKKRVLYSPVSKKIKFKKGDKVLIVPNKPPDVMRDNFPVSYTHLDVYKRQVHTNATIVWRC